MRIFRCCFIVLQFVFFAGNAQTNFRSGFELANPISRHADLTLTEKVEIHTRFKDSAIKQHNQLHILYGHLFHYYDYLLAQDFTTAANYLLQAEKVANDADNAGWQGWVTSRKAQLASFLDEKQKALENYIKAAELCGKAGDSLCVAESFEQMSSMYSKLGQQEKAEEYFHIALPLLEKYGTAKHLSVTYNNRGNFLIHQKKPLDAIPYLIKARDYFHANELFMEEGKSMNNIAEALRQSGKIDSAISLFNSCIEFNREKGFLESMIKNYHGLHQCFADKGMYKQSLENYVRYAELRDSLTGGMIKEKIANMEATFKASQAELDSEKQRSKMMIEKGRLERYIYLVLILLFIAIGVIIRKRKQHERARAELTNSLYNLKNLTQLLISKNTRITELEEQLTKPAEVNGKSEESEAGFSPFYNQRILTKEDWASFKVYFEKSFPGYIQKLRTAFPDVSEAEERLFLFIKLNLTNSEAASILGISADSIKKTRNRLRKRLNLDQSVSLDEFIRGF